MNEENVNGLKHNWLPCNCKFCGGQLRDRRTVRNHLSNHFYNRTEERPQPNNVNVPNDECSRVVGRHTSPCFSGVSIHDQDENDSHSLDNSDNDNSNYDIDIDDDEGNYGIDIDDDEGSGISDGDDEDNDDYFSGSGSQEESDGSDEETMSVDSDSANHNSDGSEEIQDNIDKDLEKCILRILNSKVQYGWSQEETLCQLRNLYELIKDEHIPHKTWPLVMKFLKKLGYKNPRHFKVCCGLDHVTLIEDDSCPNCDTPKNKCADYFVLGINLKSIFLSSNKIKDHLAHWNEKDHWLNKEKTDVPYKEVWHGSRFCELSYFWDQSKESYLPTCCPNCENIISLDEIGASSMNGLTSGGLVHLSCPESTFDFVHTLKTMKGSPLNQAFLFHEDGFNAFIKKTRGISAIHISDGCTKKEMRLHQKNMDVYSFIPTCLLKEGIPHKMDAFLKPLIDDITDLYLNGVNVYIPEDIELPNLSISKGWCKVRALLLLGTADMKAHAEMTLYAAGGRHGCRRCLISGTYIPCRRHYYYGNFGDRYHHRVAPRTALYHLEHGKNVDTATTASQRREIQVATGVTGVSILFDLYRLYKFNPILDMVIDRMHLTFNMLKKEFLEKMWVDIGDNKDKEVNDRDPSIGGLLNRDVFSKALQAVKWSTEDKAMGVARLNSLSDKLGGWKSNEYKRFSSVAREVLTGKIPSKAYDSYMLLCSAVQMLYSKQLQINGWREEHKERLEQLLWTHAIRAEEYYGLAFCTENLEYSTHVAGDIMRHSSMDNYSCELYERAILTHKGQKHNSKGLEKTFSTRENIKKFLNDYQEKNGPLCTYGHEQSPYKFNLDNETSPFYLHESSFNAAKLLIQDLQQHKHVAAIDHAVSFGVAIGAIKKKTFPHSVIDDLQRFFNRQGINIQVPNALYSLKSVVLKDDTGDVIRVCTGCTCKIDANNGTEWIMEVSQMFMIGPVDGNYHSFVNGTYYIPTLNHGNVILHDWTKNEQLIPRMYVRDSVQPTNKLRRKVIIYPDPSNIENPNYFLCIDHKHPDIQTAVHVPVYPRVQDNVCVQGPANELWYGLVQDVDREARKLTVQWYTETRRQGVWTLSSQEDVIHFSSIIKSCKVNRTFGGYSIS